VAGGGRLSDWHDRLSGSDPGAVRFLTALRATVGLLAVMGAEYALIHLTGALEISVGPGVSPAQAGAQHHETLVIAMLLAGTLALVTGLAISDPTAGQQLLSLLVAPVFVVASLAVGLTIGGHRGWALASFPVLLALGGYLRKFGPRGFISGVLLFIGDFIGFLLHGTLGLGDLGWLTAEIGVAVAALMVVRLLLFAPDRARAVRRLQRSYQARASRVADLAIAVLDDPSVRTRRRLARQLVRLNEAALLIDAQLDRDAGRLHQRLFDIELALTNLARFSEAMATSPTLDPVVRAAVRRALVAVRTGDLLAAQRAASDLTAHLRPTPPGPAPGDDRSASVIPHRFATTVTVYAEATGEWLALGRGASGTGPNPPPFTSVVELRSGWLPGSSLVSADAATAGRAGGRRRVRLPMNVRSAIQMAVAVAAAVAIGDAISPARFYWAVLAAFLAFVGTNHVAEQVRKAVYRVLGTVVGIILGSALVRLTGHHTVVSVALILISLFLGVYLFRISYAFMVIAITIAIAQVYVQLDEYSTSLLLTRLVETVIGSAVALVVIVVVFPLRTSDVFGLAVTRELQALRQLAAEATDRLAHPGRPARLRDDARELDAAHQALVSTAAPLRWAVLGDLNRGIGTTLASAAAARNYGRNLVADVEASGPLDPAARATLVAAAGALDDSLGQLIEVSQGGRTTTYLRSSALFDRVDRALEDVSPADPRRLVLRDLTLVDGALARMAAAWGMDVAGLDTGREPSSDRHAPSGA
jgi:hypothetical protein